MLNSCYTYLELKNSKDKDILSSKEVNILCVLCVHDVCVCVCVCGNDVYLYTCVCVRVCGNDVCICIHVFVCVCGNDVCIYVHVFVFVCVEMMCVFIYHHSQYNYNYYQYACT